ncbi:metallophosphoesterase [Leptolyngbya sp. 'hensonii']|uniref:metallophosphoesterase family protein n=1 Tax=Leptolyngbya sp. 'hensonii' TaxID=1922337 RepID=UPI000950026F|nr:metallophosphoesterase family protein [Leptolyngbya sp. 'hensonii']OLP17836.1 metallophosphoesterase [Leptolyngbya sp. 'hensonii']
MHDLPQITDATSVPPELLTQPFLQLPSATSVRVVWFTEFAGSKHWVVYGENLEQSVPATTTKLSRTREDQHSKLPTLIQRTTPRSIWRHEAIVEGLRSGQRLPYRVESQRQDGKIARSDPFSLAAAPEPGMPLKILLTSDHQLKPLVAANLQKVKETIGPVDAVFFAGDLVNVPDRASEWFDDDRGNAFFPVLQGQASFKLEKAGTITVYRGGDLIQSAPLFPAIGNHEVMGRFSEHSSLNDQFGDPVPRWAAQQAHPTLTLKPQGWKDYSFNTDTYEEIFTLPEDSPGGKQYYAVTFGDVRLIVLYATNIWRSPSLAAGVRGKYRERDVENPLDWGYGQHIFEAIGPGSAQYNWLQQELQRPEFQQAKYRIVMFHHPPHSLGENVVPAYTDPVQVIDRDDRGDIHAIRYEYPQSADYLVRDVVPLLEEAGVQLVFYGHSHLWNRFISPRGTHFLETSNVGNSYGAYVGTLKRKVPAGKDYAETGNPNGLDPIVPTIAPLLDAGQSLPYIASNDITAFSILDTGTGTISSYYFDTRKPESAGVKFDEFRL